MSNDNRRGFQRMDVYIAAREFVQVVVRASSRDAEMHDQATRAAKSMFLNLAEGLPSRSIAMRRKFFSASHGSLAEAVAAMDWSGLQTARPMHVSPTWRSRRSGSTPFGAFERWPPGCTSGRSAISQRATSKR